MVESSHLGELGRSGCILLVPSAVSTGVLEIKSVHVQVSRKNSMWRQAERGIGVLS